MEAVTIYMKRPVSQHQLVLVQPVLSPAVSAVSLSQPGTAALTPSTEARSLVFKVLKSISCLRAVEGQLTELLQRIFWF